MIQHIIWQLFQNPQMIMISLMRNLNVTCGLASFVSAAFDPSCGVQTGPEAAVQAEA